MKAELALPLAGLMSLEPFETVKEELEHLRAAAKDLAVRWPNRFCRSPSCLCRSFRI